MSPTLRVIFLWLQRGKEKPCKRRGSGKRERVTQVQVAREVACERRTLGADAVLGLRVNASDHIRPVNRKIPVFL